MYIINNLCYITCKVIPYISLLIAKLIKLKQFNFYLTVAKNGDVCISILHDPGEDKFGYERPEERWLPIHTVETIMVSVISMLADPNEESPANLDAAVSTDFLNLM